MKKSAVLIDQTTDKQAGKETKPPIFHSEGCGQETLQFGGTASHTS